MGAQKIDLNVTVLLSTLLPTYGIQYCDWVYKNVYDELSWAYKYFL